MKRESKMENEDKALKSQMALRRCAKAALLLSELKSLPTLTLQDNTVDYQDERMLRRQIQDLKIRLVKERLNTKKIKLCALVEFIVQILLLLSFWTLLLLFAIESR